MKKDKENSAAPSLPKIKRTGRTRKTIRIVLLLCTALLLAAGSIFGWILLKRNHDAAEAMQELLSDGSIVEESGGNTLTEPIAVHMSESMRAVHIRPGQDFFSDQTADASALEAEVDKLFERLETYGMDTLFVDVLADGAAIFPAEGVKQVYESDLLKLLCNMAAQKDVRVYAVFPMNALRGADGVHYFCPSLTAPELLDTALRTLCSGYELSGAEISNCAVEKTGELYAQYTALGADLSFPDYLFSISKSAAYRAVHTIKRYKPSLPVGLGVPPVWKNGEENGGSATSGDYESWTDGFCDTKSIAQSGTFDFIDVSIPYACSDSAVPFAVAAQWWGSVCKEANMPMLVTHAGEKAGGDFSGTDEYARQVSIALKSGSYCGSVFTGFPTLSGDPGGCMTILMKYYADEYEEEELFKDLTVTLPAQKNVTTYEESIQFRGSFDSTQEVKLNGEVIKPSQKGGFSEWVPLKVGVNTITLEHKGKTAVYTVERRLLIIKSVTPSSAMTVAGGTRIELSAVAYKGAKVTATLDGKTVTLTESGGGEENSSDSLYVNYRGTYVCPASLDKEQALGRVKFAASYNGYSASQNGSAVTVAKKAASSGSYGDSSEQAGQVLRHAVVNAAYAETYPYLSTPAYPEGVRFPLPKGTCDIIESTNGDFLNLRSGTTIKASDASVQNIAFGGNNTVRRLTAGVEGTDTVVRIALDWKAPFSLALSPGPSAETDIGTNYTFTANTVTVLLDYASAIETENVAINLGTSPIFSGIKTERVYDPQYKMYRMKLTMTLRKTGRYYGCYAEYAGNTLVLKFNHPSTSSLSGIKICVDAGHGGVDSGTVGRDTYEKTVNLQQAEKIAAELRKRGAAVIMTRTTDVYLSLDQRVQIADANQCDLFISVHHNSNGNDAKPNGFQTYYNNPFSQPLAQAVQSQVNTVRPNTGWNLYNGPCPHYNFRVTRSKQRPGVLLECGYLSNPSDEAAAMNTAHQQRIAEAVAQGVVNYYNNYR